MPANVNATGGDDGGRLADEALSWGRVRSALEGVRYGEVRIIIQDGVIVQIERVEKQRLA
jgi:hypothetical protein